MARFVEVAFPIPLPSTFTYGLPKDISQVKIGQRVLVPFQKRTLTGYVVDLPKEAGEIKTKAVHAVLDDVPLLTPELLKLAGHMSQKYDASFSEALSVLVPPGVDRHSKRRLIASQKIGSPENELERSWLEKIRGKKGLDYASAIRKTPSLKKVFRSLEKSGWVEFENFLSRERAVEHRIAFYELTATAPDETKIRGRVRKEVFAILREQRIVSMDELRPLGKSVSSTLREWEQNGWLQKTEQLKSVSRSLASLENEQNVGPELSKRQSESLEKIQAAMAKGRFEDLLLHGITGSGKTEVYLRASQSVVQRGKEVLALVPEISLTPQFVGRFRRRFGDEVAVLHSGLSPSQRLTEWRRIREGMVKVVIGARSAVFAPLEKIGLIIVDEEHDASYKQEDGLRYDARDLAEFRAKQKQALVLRGSATPSLETYHRTESDDHLRLELPDRVTAHSLPVVEIVDLRKEALQITRGEMISPRLQELLVEVLEKGDQAILFLNRRGFAPMLLCPSCGTAQRCPNCSVTMTFHESDGASLCHYCGQSYEEMPPCQDCGKTKYVKLGTGTERVEKELHYLFPDARIERMDRDSVRKKGRHESIIGKLLRRETDILVGTQMVTKGLDMPHVSLVGALAADQGLHFPDFRAAERTFQLVTQVVGRSGRGKNEGKAVIQTFQPEHYAIKFAANQDYSGFYQQEVEFRRALRYPPFSSLALIDISGENEMAVQQSARWLSNQGGSKEEMKERGLEFLGPSPAPIRKIAGRSRYHLLVRSKPGSVAAKFARWLVNQSRKPLADRGIDLKLDINPLQFL